MNTLYRAVGFNKKQDIMIIFERSCQKDYLLKKINDHKLPFRYLRYKIYSLRLQKLTFYGITKKEYWIDIFKSKD